MGIINKITKIECDKCGTLESKSRATLVQFDGKIRYLCKECSWDLEKWFHTKPLQFGDEQQVTVVNTNQT